MMSRCVILIFGLVTSFVQAFVWNLPPIRRTSFVKSLSLETKSLVLFESSTDGSVFKKVPEDLEAEPIPFLDAGRSSFIECYADSVASVSGEEYTIGVPCDYCVALCFFEGENNLVPVELDDGLMDDVFPLAESIVADEFGEDLVLERTPQTLTLIGELEEDGEDDADLDDDEEDEAYEGAEEVEVLLSFEHEGTEFSLVRLLDPVLLVGKSDPERPEVRILLTPEEAQMVMPQLEDIFLKFHERDSLVP